MTRALVDCDGVLADFLTPCLDIINRLMTECSCEAGKPGYSPTMRHHSTCIFEIGRWDRPRTLDEMTNWNIFECLGVPPEVKSETYRRMKKPGWCEYRINPLPGAQEGIQLLRDAKIEIFVVTSPMSGDTWHSERERWLKRHFDVNHDHVIHAQKKHVITGQCLIDDKPSHVEDWVSHNGPLGVLWEYHTNRGYTSETPDDHLIHTCDWKTVHERLTDWRF